MLEKSSQITSHPPSHQQTIFSIYNDIKHYLSVYVYYNFLYSELYSNMIGRRDYRLVTIAIKFIAYKLFYILLVKLVIFQYVSDTFSILRCRFFVLLSSQKLTKPE